MSLLDHANVVRFLGFSLERDEAAMELCDQTLAAFKHVERWLSFQEIAYLTKQVLSGLCFTHSKDVIHG